MHYLVYISCAFLGMQLFNVLLNIIFRQKISTCAVPHNELVSVLIPARNEEANIGNILSSLQGIQNHRMEILVCNDQSTDYTEEIVQNCAKQDARLRLIQSGPLPHGWLGKNHACFQLAREAKGTYFLFVDADVIVRGNCIAGAISFLQKHRLGLLSVFPKQRLLSVGEKRTVPLMNYILLTLLPLIFVRVSPFKSHAAANGQFMLFNADIYKALQPHETFKSSAVEDIAVSRFYKSKKIKIACIAGEEQIQCRMYTSYSDAMQGFSKNIFMFFGNVPAVAFLFWALASFGFVPVIVSNLRSGLAYLAVIILIQILYAVTAGQSILTTVLYFPAHMVFMLQVLIKAFIFKKRRNNTWKGRPVY